MAIVDVVLALTIAVLVENSEALFWAFVFFHIPIIGEIDIVRVFQKGHPLQ